jgi:tyrosine-protein kinase Etk/Wzc
MNTLFSDKQVAQHSYGSEQEEDQIDLGEIIGIILDGKYVIASLAGVFLLGGMITAVLQKPVYKTDGMLQLEEKSSSIPALEMIQPLLEAKVPALAEIEIIKSRKVLGETVKNLNLDIIAEPKHYPVIGDAIARRFERSNVNHAVSEPLLGHTSYAWGGEAIKIDSLAVPENWIGKPLVLSTGEQRHFSLSENGQHLLDGEVGKTASKALEGGQGLLTLFVSELKARPETEFVISKQSSVNAISQLQTHLVVVEKVKNTGILSFTLESTNPVLAAQTLNEVANIYVRQNVEQKSKEAQSTLEFLDKQLPIVKEQLDASTKALNEYRSNKGSVDLDTETQNVLAGMVETKTQLTLLQQKRDEARGKFTESHPSIIAIDKQIARLKSQVAEHDRKIEVLPETQQVILRLSRDVKASTELYTTLLNNAQTLKVAKAGTVGNVRVIDEAVVPTIPIKPNRLLIVGVALVLGLAVGVVLVFIRRALHQGVDDPNKIEKYLDVPVYATVPHSRQQEKLNDILRKSDQPELAAPLILGLEHNDDLAIESLRSLRTSLHFAFLEATNNIIMISGPSPGIGKTFVSTNLAMLLAQAGKKILLIDADLRRGAINNSLGVKRESGLSDLISNSVGLDKAIHHIDAANFDFIPTGSIPPNPSELLLHERFGQLLAALTGQYDHILIDSPPILAVTDACIIGQLASVSLMVVKSGQHPMRELEQSTKRLIQAGVSIKGIVFNDMPPRSGKYGYGYGYGKYGYSYSYKSTS